MSDSYFMIWIVIYLAIIVLMVAAMWVLFEKAGQPGWGAIIPIYNMVLLLNVAGRPIWWIILYFIPIVSFIVWLVVCYDVAKNFGHGILLTIGLIFLPFIFFPVLAFGSSEYNP